MTNIQNRCRLVTRQGVVVGTHDRTVDVQIVQMSACASCQLRGVCSASDARAKTVLAQSEGNLRLGDTVELSMEEKYGLLAVLFAFLVPLILMVAALFLSQHMGASEATAALLSLAVPALYFVLIYRFRNVFRNTIHLHATPYGKEGLS